LREVVEKGGLFLELGAPPARRRKGVNLRAQGDKAEVELSLPEGSNCFLI